MATKPLIGINGDFRAARKDTTALSWFNTGYYDSITAAKIKTGPKETDVTNGIPLLIPPLDDDGEIRFVDEHVGKVLARLDEKGLGDSTVVLIVADHGEEFQDHGGFWHGTTLYDEALLSKGVGIKFDGQEKTNVEEYCVSEGWIRVAVGKTVDRKGNPLTIKLKGKVEPYLQKP